MPDIKFFSECHMCKRKRLFVRRATVTLPVVDIKAKSKDYLCNKHVALLRNNIK